jgi:phenylacetate-CoA ligase
MKEFSGIDKFQVLQEDIDNLCIKIVKKNDISESNLNLMKEEIFKVMGNKINVNFNFVDEIPLTTTGKFRVVNSRVPLVAGKKNEAVN